MYICIVVYWKFALFVLFQWKDSQNVAAVKYVGNLLKFSLSCTESSGVKVSSCLLGKIIGDKEFNGGMFPKNLFPIVQK